MKRSLKEFFSLGALKSALIIPKAIFNILNWPEFLLNYLGFTTKKENLYIFRNGMKFLTDNEFDVATIAVVCLRKEYGNTKDKNVVIDIGANIGSFSILTGKDGTLVYAYEPMKNTYNLLKKNVELNNLQNNVRIFNLGVADKTGSKKLYLNNKGGSAYNSMYIKQKKFTTINCISLDDVFKNNNISKCDLIKIDVEGAEYEIFYNASSITLDKINEIRMEYHNVNGNNIEELLTYLQKYNFEVIKRRDDSNFSGIIWLKKTNYMCILYSNQIP